LNLFEQIKREISLLNYASKFLSLKQKGNSYSALCPFHAEKTPSFTIDCDKDLFYCFGCGAAGDLIEFYVKYHASTKKEALIELCELAGIEIQKHSEQAKHPLRILNDFFVKEGENSDVFKNFLKLRNISEKDVEKFGIGWSPAKSKIISFIRENNLDLSEYNFDDIFWSMFENRVVFPIFDPKGKICSFGGRALDKRAKYINGRASKFFDKSATLYGANFLKSRSKVFLVEGYLDVIAVQRAGFDAVAALGTSFTKQHLELAWNLNSNLVVGMDSDLAGYKTSLKVGNFAFDLLQPGKTIKFVKLPDNEDPDSFLQLGGSLDSIKELALHEFMFEEKVEIMSSPDASCAFLDELLQKAGRIQDFNLKIRYQKAFRKIWWQFGKGKKSFVSKIPKLDVNDNFLLLFKYVFMFPGILEDVSERFFKLISHDESLSLILISILEGEEISSDFKEKALNIISDDIETEQDALSFWNFLADMLEKQDTYGRIDIVKSFKRNFSDQSWENFKNLLILKGEEDV
jgi:DNA primase